MQITAATDYGSGGYDWTNPSGGCGTGPTFDQPYETTPKNQPIVPDPNDTIQFPQSDSQLKSYAQSSTGCYYIGPTFIVLSVNSTTGAGQMTVVSPLTTATYGGSDACVGTNVALPSNGVIYVDSGTENCQAAFTWSGSYQLGWAIPDSATGDLPAGDECGTTTTPGEVFIQGTLKGALTVGAADNEFITGDLTYADGYTGSSQDVLGLIANDFVEIDHPVTSSGANIYGTEPFQSGTSIDVPADYGNGQSNGAANKCQSGASPVDCDVTVDAAILSLNHSLGVQDFAKGSPWGTLTINGALAQEFMDIEGTFGPCSYTTQGVATQLCHGMNSVYTYDARLAHLSPPYFLAPSYAQWKELSFQECLVTGCQGYNS